MRTYWLRFVFLRILLIASITGCNSEPPPKHISRAFYYWKSELSLKPTEREALTRLRTDAIYVKFFDIAWDAARHAALPVAMLRFDSSTISPQQIIPVVFLTEESLANTGRTQIVELAHHAAASIQSIATNMRKPITEVQFDCDWTDRTREKYFAFIDAARAALPQGTMISSTIRLHQIKYHERTGVPPVDRGMLMYYNMANWREPATKNSIIDQHEAEKYIDYVHDYPLPLDLALPIFRWTLVYRNNQFLTILNSLGTNVLDLQSFLSRDSRGRCVVEQDTLAFGIALLKGDLLRAEECTPDELKSGGSEVLRRIRNSDVRIALYHLDSASLSHYSNGTLDSLFQNRP